MWRGRVPSPSYAEQSAQLARMRPTVHFEFKAVCLCCDTSYSGDLNLEDYNLANNTASDMAAYGSCEAENGLNQAFGPDFEDEQWIETQVLPWI